MSQQSTRCPSGHFNCKKGCRPAGVAAPTSVDKPGATPGAPPTVTPDYDSMLEAARRKQSEANETSGSQNGWRLSDLSPEDRQEWEARAALLEQRVAATEEEVMRRAENYYVPSNAGGPLTSEEREALETACMGNPYDRVTERTLDALDVAEQDAFVGSTIRRCYFNPDGSLRNDLGQQSNYTSSTVAMNVEMAKAVQQPGRIWSEQRDVERLAALVHATTEYVNDRKGYDDYPNGGNYPNLDGYALKVTGKPLFRWDGSIGEALAHGHYGPNAG